MKWVKVMSSVKPNLSSGGDKLGGQGGSDHQQSKKKRTSSLAFQLIIWVIVIFLLMTFISSFIIRLWQEKITQDIVANLGGVLTAGDQPIDNAVLVIEETQVNSTTEFRLFYSVVLFVTALLGSAAFYWIIGRKLRPLEDLSRDIAKIDIDQLDDKFEPVPVPRDSFELEGLAESFNGTLEKIAQTYAKEKNFSNNVAHELRTPLAVLQAKIDLYKKKAESKSPADMRDFLDLLERKIQGLSDLVDSILFLSRDEKLNIQKIDIRLLLEEITFDLEDKAMAKEQTLLVTGRDIFVESDDQLLARAIFNLVDNAIKYSDEPGQITVSCQKLPDQQGLSDGQNRVLIQVKDQGVGITEAEKGRVFDLFYRVDNSRNKAVDGYGIGLALVKHIVSRLKGRLWLESNQPKGTSVSLVLPERLK